MGPLKNTILVVRPIITTIRSTHNPCIVWLKVRQKMRRITLLMEMRMQNLQTRK
jgi:hypothetical protein